MSSFAPVFLPDDRRPNGRLSMTALRHYAQCPRSGYLYFLHKGGVQTREMVRGSAFHAVADRSIRLMVERGEPTIPPEIVKDVVNEVLAEYPVVLEDHDFLREMSYRFAAELAIDPAMVVACETLFTLDVGGVQVRAKIDYAALTEDGAAITVKDWKTSRSAPAYEEISRKRPDKTIAGKSTQLIVYALALAFGVPVRVEEPQNWWKLSDEHDWEPVPLPGADASELYEAHQGTVRFEERRAETPEPFSVASQAQRFDVEFVYPGAENLEGRMATRPMTLTRLELVEYRASLEAIVARVRASEETGDWPAVISDAACSECPAASLCPIPAELRDHRGTVNTPGEAAEAAAVLDREKAEHRARQTELRNWAKVNGEIRYGGKVMELVYSEHEEIFDKEGFLAAVERAVRYGDPLERSDYVRTKGRTDFKARDLTEDELLEGSNGGSDSESGASAADRGGTLDERFGADAPY